MFFHIAKIYAFRLWGLWLMLAGMGIMILGLLGIVLGWGLAGQIMASIFMLLGGVAMIGSLAVYFYAGVLSNQASVIVCPNCQKTTKMLGKTDRCMFCKTVLTFDPSQATEFPENEQPEGETKVTGLEASTDTGSNSDTGSEKSS